MSLAAREAERRPRAQAREDGDECSATRPGTTEAEDLAARGRAAGRARAARRRGHAARARGSRRDRAWARSRSASRCLCRSAAGPAATRIVTRSASTSFPRAPPGRRTSTCAASGKRNAKRTAEQLGIATMSIAGVAIVVFGLLEFRRRRGLVPPLPPPPPRLRWAVCRRARDRLEGECLARSAAWKWPISCSLWPIR